MLGGSATVLAVCAGFQILGTDFTDPRGVRHAGLDLVDASTVPRSRRAVGQVVARCVGTPVGLPSGFENHGGATRLGPGTMPLAQVLAGCGNGSDDESQIGAEGALAPRLVATYLHGPVLARNPDLADHLLGMAVGSTFAPPAEDRVPDAGALRAAYLGPHRARGTTAGPPAIDHSAFRAAAAPLRLRLAVTAVLLVAAVIGVLLALSGVHA